MNGCIDNTDCYWMQKEQVATDMNGNPAYVYGCVFNKGEWAPCTIDSLCCRYVSHRGIDDYIRMLLEAVGEV